MSLYLVVHHKQDMDQPWVNGWLDDYQLEAIQTTAKIGRLCEAARSSGEWVFVHRCGWGQEPPSICCAVRVVVVTPLPGGGRLVQFAQPRLLGISPPCQPSRGQNFYEAPPAATV